MNNIVKPETESAEIYPKQEFEEPKGFKFNSELLVNAFRSGYNYGHVVFENMSLFPYREDNKPIVIERQEIDKTLANTMVHFKFSF